MESFLREVFTALGAHQVGVIGTEEIQFSQEIRSICAGNGCGRYGTTWACPPGVGSVEACQALCLEFPKIFVFTQKYDLEDSFDFEGMQAGHDDFKRLCDAAYARIQPRGERFRLLSNEGCQRCKVCTYPDAPCRFPDRLYPAIEGFGIMVNELAKSASVRYINGKDTVTYFGAVLF